MEVHALGWFGLALTVLVLITIDVVGHVRKPHAPSLREAASWTVGYISLAALFGLLILSVYGASYAIQFYAGYVTEWSLSLDNLFVFMIIISAFRVPREYQQKALLCGIVLALLFRMVFIMVGVTLIERFSWVFFLFGGWLIWTAVSQVREALSTDTATPSGPYEENAFMRLVRRVLPVSDGFRDDKMVVRSGSKRFVTPLLLTVVALGTADLMFAFDSIPAIFGLTHEAFLVFACNAFALLGLRQLFFLVDALLSRLVFLNFGLAAILGFIGIKLVLQALRENELMSINGGKSVPVPDVGIGFSMAFIVGTLTVTVIASVLRSRYGSREELVSQSGV